MAGIVPILQAVVAPFSLRMAIFFTSKTPVGSASIQEEKFRSLSRLEANLSRLKDLPLYRSTGGTRRGASGAIRSTASSVPCPRMALRFCESKTFSEIRTQ